jgi:hypothetical protein
LKFATQSWHIDAGGLAALRMGKSLYIHSFQRCRLDAAPTGSALPVVLRPYGRGPGRIAMPGLVGPAGASTQDAQLRCCVHANGKKV